ncbi:glutathione S-transferase 1-like [Sitodiplosis mosellana]|uniref:glutathione S-transferase 1-like n=1 Tax=Sitodiplosis mosellana TaxID=263140 RepID=UPI002444871F|nr:glutathione S-transferase 1-like [Sitodiplosis mosellana]
MSPLVLYYFAPSAPCRIALSTIRCLDLDVELRIVDLFKKEQLQEEFVKLNPQHTVPTLVDDGFVLIESRAIAIYLIEKNFQSGHSLYPKDAKERALINQKLQFDCGTLYPRIRAVCLPILFGGQTKISDDNRQKLFDAVEFLNTFLEGKTYVAGSEQPTIADLSIFTSIANIVELGADLSKYPNVVSWYETCKQLPGSAENVVGAKEFAGKITSLWQDKL